MIITCYSSQSLDVFLITTFNSFDYLSPDQVCYRDVKEKEIGKL